MELTDWSKGLILVKGGCKEVPVLYLKSALLSFCGNTVKGVICSYKTKENQHSVL